ncbi:MAG: hypothetical protein KDA53_10115 [Hyphomonas sp.]|nr:hypothetical protein [Hyphomonas sp.]
MRVLRAIGLSVVLAGCASQSAITEEAGATAAQAAPAPQPAAAATPAPAPPPPCSTDEYHDFDFWIGEWDVFGPNGAQAGINSIQPAESGCLLIEHWTNTGGGTGQSYNFYDPGIGKWRQLWVSAGAVIDYAGGLTETGSMLLEGEIRYHGAGGTANFTGEWTPNEDGSVTQHFRQQNAETGDWSDWFIGTYVRKADEATDVE